MELISSQLIQKRKKNSSFKIFYVSFLIFTLCIEKEQKSSKILSTLKNSCKNKQSKLITVLLKTYTFCRINIKFNVKTQDTCPINLFTCFITHQFITKKSIGDRNKKIHFVFKLSTMQTCIISFIINIFYK